MSADQSHLPLPTIKKYLASELAQNEFCQQEQLVFSTL